MIPSNRDNRETALRASSSVAVRIVLYDLLGRELRIIEESEKAAGTYSTLLDGSGLPSGTYLLHLQFGNLSATKPITILR